MNNIAQEERININVKIVAFEFNMSVPLHDEAFYREAGKRLNKRIADYKARYPQISSSEQILAMAAFEIAVENAKGINTQSVGSFLDKVESLSAEIKEVL